MTIVSVRAQPCKMISLHNQSMHACMHLFYVASVCINLYMCMYIHVDYVGLCIV